MTDQDPLGLDGVTPDEASVVTIGTFDGVHAGHREIIATLIDRAKRNNGCSTVVTFDPHPREVTTGTLVPLLTTARERTTLLEALGVERCIVIPFTRDFAQIQSDEFIVDIVCGRIGAREIVVGYDHAFGRNRSGNRTLLQQLGKKHGFAVTIVPPLEREGGPVSSSRIRQLLSGDGDVATAGSLLGRHYGLDGRVVHGDGRGRSIGFPTANLEVVSTRKAIPLRGVYAVRVTIPETTDAELPGHLAGVYDGMMNIGVRPTFGGSHEVHLEVHLLDFDATLYGATLHVEFVERLRAEKKFASIDALIEQLSLDQRRCRVALQAVS